MKMITGPSFGGSYNNYYKIQCTDYIQAKKLMAEMEKALRNAVAVTGSKKNEVIVSGLKTKADMKNAFECLKNSSNSESTNLSRGKIIDLYKTYIPKAKTPKDEERPRINIKL